MSRKTFSHLTPVKRMQIQQGLSSGLTQRAIAQMVDVHPSTISRELKRHRTEQGSYEGAVAQTRARTRRELASQQPRKVTQKHLDYIYDRLMECESPDVISHCAPAELRLSTTWVYELLDRRIRNNPEDAEDFKPMFLRKYTRRHGRKRNAAGVSLIPNRVDISERPAHVENRQQFGHWEGDTVIGKGYQGVLLTLVERKTRFMVSCPLQTKTRDEVATAIVDQLSACKAAVRTITFDNGGEFAGHEQVKEQLQCDTYFAKPYRSYERGSNENLNGEIRRYYPKSRPLADLHLGDYQFAISIINRRRRKILQYESAQERFDRELALLVRASAD